MNKFDSPKAAVDKLIQTVGKNIIMAAPLGAGKANHILNEIYLRAKNDPSINFTLLTALTLQVPKAKSFIEKQFMGPFLQRVFKNYPNLTFENDRLNQSLPDNVKIIEFYYKAGQFKDNAYGQQNYLSSNYTHVARDVFNRGVNVICQQVCHGSIDDEAVLSLSCNPDISIDLVNLLKANGREFVTIGQTNQDLPFMYGESIVPLNFFDILVDNRELDYAVFAPPKMAIPDVDYMIGLHASSLIKDNGEIQIGIGSLGDALVYGLGLRQENNDLYRKVLKELEIDRLSFPVIEQCGETEEFNIGLFASTEMLVDSFASLYQKGILKKKVYDSVILQRLLNEGEISEEFDESIFDVLQQHKAISQKLSIEDVEFLKEYGIIRSGINFQEGRLITQDNQILSNDIHELDRNLVIGERLRNGAVAHGGFFLGPRSFYDFLKDLPVEERKLFRMRKISQINQLYGHEEIDRLQRVNGRFINTCMKVSLNGQACSDALEDYNQISGVGGQYNFVAMAHELPDARSVLQLRSFRTNAEGKLESNIVFNYANCTIPRHLRDIVITEYGIADLRSKTDEEVASALIQIADSRFQAMLISQAKKANKLPNNFQLDKRFTNNYPQRYLPVLKAFKSQGLFKPFPLGHDFTQEELEIGKGLKKLKALQSNKIKFYQFLLSAIFSTGKKSKYQSHLKRMNLDNPQNSKEKVYQKLLLKALG
ncbi:acetyl-CoA hydrolase/transferase C-terminal domain-containing protein [Aliikangiella marina]|nr:acetyl-CoA hydrolase/transferase C-terminal domain-containing protein [Aliikangiella marina]